MADVSTCHLAPVKVVGDSFGEGTNHYECTQCGESCDAQVKPEVQTTSDVFGDTEIINGPAPE